MCSDLEIKSTCRCLQLDMITNEVEKKYGGGRAFWKQVNVVLSTPGFTTLKQMHSIQLA